MAEVYAGSAQADVQQELHVRGVQEMWRGVGSVTGEGPDGYLTMTPEQRAAYKEAKATLWGALYGRQGYGKGMQAKRKMGATTGRMSAVNPDLKAIPGHPRVFAEARAEFQETFCKFNYDWQTPKKEAND